MHATGRYLDTVPASNLSMILCQKARPKDQTKEPVIITTKKKGQIITKPTLINAK